MKGSILPLRRTRETALPIALVSSRTDGGGGGAEVHDLNFRDAPLQLFFRDIKLVLTLLRWLPKLFSPLRTENPYGELYFSSRNIWEILLHVILGLCGGLMVLVSVPLLIAAPVSLFVLYVVVCRGLMFLLSWPLNSGPRSVMSNADLGDVVAKPEEKWAFVNGVCAGQYWLQANVDMISSIFKRPVLGIHNRSYGAVFDLIECIIHRCFSYATKDTRYTYEYLKGELMSPAVTKVVVIAHSQGGIILSATLDMLLADLPSEVFEKLEIYTFGYIIYESHECPTLTKEFAKQRSAANHFNNPLCRFPPSQDQRPSTPAHRQIRHIEHYCNEYDFVSRFGTLHCTRDGKSNRFAGIVFERKKQGGHLMNQHYLDAMFSREDSPFLEQVVDIEEPAVDMEKGVVSEVRREAADGEGPQIGTPGWGEPALLSAEEGMGKTVKGLSRLWRYRNGGSP